MAENANQRSSAQPGPAARPSAKSAKSAVVAQPVLAIVAGMFTARGGPLGGASGLGRTREEGAALQSRTMAR